ncbi:MAG: NAD-dependent epimerase/dehydratase family protein [Polyangiaceae bacterium]|nr:NAD-dependent epimerase/dehydratase family protein [Polyangiaceae bacterium]
MSHYLVTGAAGFLGRHVVAALLADGHEVTALVRPGSRPELPGAHVAQGDVLDPASLDAASRGADGVFHLAGKVSRDPADAELLHGVHVRGTRNVLAAARSAGARRVVVASTSGTVGISESPEVRDESSPTPRGLIARFPYYRTKLQAEEEALRASDGALEVVAVNPSLLLGPGDVNGSSTEDVGRFLTRAIPAVPAGGLAFVDARDAAAGAVAAMARGRAGERYLLNACNLTVRDFFGRLERLSGVASPRLPLPRHPVLSRELVRAARALVGVIGGELPVDLVSAEMGRLYWYVDAKKAERELGFSTRDAQETLADTVADLTRR